MLTPPLYVLKVKYFDDSIWRFVCEGFISSPKEVEANNNKDYFISKSLNKTKQLMLSLTHQYRPEIEALKIVELSHYPPYAEFEVIQFQEMKRQ
jgi:hypothetical protein